jgi:hypothetical protein
VLTKLLAARLIKEILHPEWITTGASEQEELRRVVDVR